MKKTNYEIQMLSRILADRNVYYSHSNLLHKGLFIKHADIYTLMVSMINEDKIPSTENLMREMPSQTDTILDIYSDLDYTIPVQLIIQELHEEYRNYILNNGCTQAAMKTNSDEKVNILTEALINLEKNEAKQVIFHASEVAKELMEELKKGINPGLLTGFASFDSHTGGLQPSDLIVIAARASQGKTSLALALSNNLIAREKKVIFISMELSKPQLILRILSADLGIPAKKAIQHYDAFHHASTMLEQKGLYLADVNNVDYRNIISIIRSSRLKYGIDVAFVDYLQLMRSADSRSREQEIGNIARAFKNLAKELDMPIVLLSQLRRPENNNYEPKLSELRDSGQIEEAADIVWLIYRPEAYEISEYTYTQKGETYSVSTRQRAFHNIAKGRNYGTTVFESGFQTALAKFFDTRNSGEPEADKLFPDSDERDPF